MNFLKTYGKWIAVVLVVIVFLFVLWYLFKDTSSTNKYVPSKDALKYINWSDIKGWQQPNGNGAWYMVSVIGNFGNNWDENTGEEWYRNNERIIYGWFKGMNYNPNNVNGGFWMSVKDEVLKYKESSSAKDFDSIKVGEFRTDNKS